MKVYEAPDELPDTAIIGRLSTYGRVLSFRRDRLTLGILNGIRTARMRLKSHVPLSLFIAGELVFLSYQSQPRTCRRCGDEGHEARTCSVVRCFNSEKAGHRIEDCAEDILCSVCRASSHPTQECTFLIFRANVQPVVPGERSYASAVKAAQPKPRAHPKPPVKNVSKPRESTKADDQSKSIEKARDKDRVRDRERERDRDRDWDRGRDRERDMNVMIADVMREGTAVMTAGRITMMITMMSDVMTGVMIVVLIGVSTIVAVMEIMTVVGLRLGAVGALIVEVAVLVDPSSTNGS